MPHLVFHGVRREHKKGARSSFPPFTITLEPFTPGIILIELKVFSVSGYEVLVASLGSNAEVGTINLELTNSEVQVTRLYFRKASKRFGGEFYFHASVCGDDKVHGKSSSIKVFCGKPSKDDTTLSPNDPVWKLSAIGKKYGKRLSEIKINTIADLARVPDSQVETILKAVRLERAALSIDTLQAAITRARTIPDDRSPSLAFFPGSLSFADNDADHPHTQPQFDPQQPPSTSSDIFFVDESTARDEPPAHQNTDVAGTNGSPLRLLEGKGVEESDAFQPCDELERMLSRDGIDGCSKPDSELFSSFYHLL